MSIKVGVRVRPFNAREKEKESVCIIEMNGSQTKISDELDQEKTFTFDHSFWSHDNYTTNNTGYFTAINDKYADQAFVFKAVGKEILDNAWEGYHCCLFAYGQTGSGKSYSMVGYGVNKGIVPISCEEIFSRIKAKDNPNKSFEVQVSMFEIYNEKIQDLLVPPNKRPHSGLKIRESKVLGIFVEGLTKYPVTLYEEISNKMEEGYQNRTIGSTLMNATSSRAHTIVIIELKQIELIAGKKGERLSMINLVDLAGSERARSTGATGDRLKEGCNINKSLLVLGNVINTLADKALGKKKDILPPYRDSALTRILQNALGGNSKTVMICALSPASINYEETLSTLRYADRAKKIQNKAVINESEHDKMVRLLKEENSDLKKMLDELKQKLIGDGGNEKSLIDNTELLNLKEQYEANRKLMIDMQKTFSEKIKEAKVKDEEANGVKVDISSPHLIVLNEDPQLSHKLKYSLKSLPVYVGRKHGNPHPQIILSGIGIKQNHAVFIQYKNDIILRASDSEAKKYIFINGKPIGEQRDRILQSKDRIIFGTNTIAMYMKSSNGNDIYDIAWEYAQLELQKEIEDDYKRQEEHNSKKKEEEVKTLKRDLEEKYSKEKNEIEEKLRQQVEIYHSKLKEINQHAEKIRIENERENIERLLKQKIDDIEMEKAKKRREIEIREQNDILNKLNSQTDIESLNENSLKLYQKVMIILKKLHKMRIILTELKRNINIELIVRKNLIDNAYLTLQNITSTLNAQPITILIKVENFEVGEVYSWSTETFFDRYDLIQELFNKIGDGRDIDIFNIKNTDDPLWDNPKPSLIGYAFYLLEPVIYLISNPCLLPIISPEGKVIGKLSVDVIPHDEQGNQFNEAPDQPDDLIGQTLMYTVYIKECLDLPSNVCKRLYVEYNYNYNDNMFNSTQCYNFKTEFSSSKTNVSIEESFEHKINYLTREDIMFFSCKRIIFKVFGQEVVKKKGRIAKGEIDNMAIITEKSKLNENKYKMDNCANSTVKEINDKACLKNNKREKEVSNRKDNSNACFRCIIV